ncbi:siphovirus Gp157 family protein [Brevibacillus agri]|uniref:siphovirus Gp157 family protein n=1 Tax=Brevibacillus agri TaxID=51101 RepID=UPI003D1B57C8
MKLYELTENYAVIAQMIADDEAKTESLGDTLQALSDAIEVKAENIAKMIRNMDAETEALRNEEKRLAERRRSLETKRDGLKRYLEEQLAIVGLDKVKTPIFTVALQNNPPSVHVLDESAIPKVFWVTPPPTLDKKLLAERLKAGDDIPGVTLQQGRSLRIR